MKTWIIKNKGKLFAAVFIAAALITAFMLGGKTQSESSKRTQTSREVVSEISSETSEQSFEPEISELSGSVSIPEESEKQSPSVSVKSSVESSADKKLRQKQECSDPVPEKSIFYESTVGSESIIEQKSPGYSEKKQPDTSEEQKKHEASRTVSSEVSVEHDKSASSAPASITEKSSNSKAESSKVSELNSSPEPEETEDDSVSDHDMMLCCSIVISCSTALDNSSLPDAKRNILPSDGIILSAEKVAFSQGESVIDALRRVCRENNIVLSAPTAPFYGGAYIAGIQDLCEYDCGPVSGWMYKVNDEFPNVGCSFYKLSDNDRVEIVYSCDLGKDVGNEYIGE